MVILGTVPGSPAEKAGLLPKDQIIAIGSGATESGMILIGTGTDLNAVVAQIKGPAGTSVTLLIERNGGTPFLVTVERAQINIPYVTYKQLPNHDNYIAITTFGDNILPLFQNAMSQVFANPYSNRLIIDLRNNPGGNLAQVSDMLNYFVPAGNSVVQVRYKNFATDTLSTGSGYTQTATKNIVVLING